MRCWTISEIDSAVIGPCAIAPTGASAHNTVSTSSLTTRSDETWVAAFELCELGRTPYRLYRKQHYGTACGNIEDRSVAVGPYAEIIEDQFSACTLESRSLIRAFIRRT